MTWLKSYMWSILPKVIAILVLFIPRYASTFTRVSFKIFQKTGGRNCIDIQLISRKRTYNDITKQKIHQQTNRIKLSTTQLMYCFHFINKNK